MQSIYDSFLEKKSQLQSTKSVCERAIEVLDLEEIESSVSPRAVIEYAASVLNSCNSQKSAKEKSEKFFMFKEQIEKYISSKGIGFEECMKIASLHNEAPVLDNIDVLFLRSNQPIRRINGISDIISVHKTRYLPKDSRIDSSMCAKATRYDSIKISR